MTRRTNDRGNGEVLGLVLLFPVMIGLAMLVVWLGRKVDAGAQVRAASEAAAQAAARQRTPAAGVRAAQQTVAGMLSSGTCAGVAGVSINTAGWRPGGQVQVTVTCTPRRADLAPLQAAPRTLRATATATIDQYRASVGSGR